MTVPANKIQLVINQQKAPKHPVNNKRIDALLIKFSIKSIKVM